MGLVSGYKKECEWVEGWWIANKSVTSERARTMIDELNHTGEAAFVVEGC